MELYDLLGLAGVASYLLSYVLRQLNMLSADRGYTYTLLNLVGASLMLVSLVQQFNLPSAIIQSCWIVISLFGLVRLRHTRETPPCRRLLSSRKVAS